MSSLWSLRDVALVSGRTTRLHGITVEVQSGVTAVLGFSGAGKTSLLNLLVGFEAATNGTVGQSLPATTLPVFWVPQNGGLWNHVSAQQHIEMVGSEVGSGGTLLSQFDLEEREASLPAALSQGERARLSVARALAADASVLVMDEPLAHVDPGRVNTYFDLVAEHVGQAERSLVFATHQPDLVLRYAENVICLDAGKVVFAGSVVDLYEKPGDSGLASLLGRGNWISADEFTFWLDQRDCADGIVRPERLRIGRCEEDRFLVVTSRCLGPITETVVRHTASGREQNFVHSTNGSLKPKQCVRLSFVGEDSNGGGEQ